MKYLNEKEVEEKTKGALSKYHIGFMCGIDFAETKIESLMIELLNFAFMNYDNSVSIKEPRYYDVNNQKHITTEQLIDEFLNSKLCVK